ncbi:MAG: M15 family metallopeptidase [Lentisphaeria bacterium]|nr:M15 family metallopeptidase [Lentisphaeria bacterium]
MGIHDAGQEGPERNSASLNGSTGKNGDPVTSGAAPSGFVRVSDVIPDVLLDIRYYSSDNFTGRRVEGYEAPVALLTREAAEALKAASDEAKKEGFRFKIFDAYRPLRAVNSFLRWAQDPADTGTKERFYPNIDKSELIRRGYIAKRSGHCRGSTVDLTLWETATGKEVDMGGTFDWFGRESHPDWCGNPQKNEYTGPFPGNARAEGGKINEEEFRNRMFLRQIMMQHGFLPIAEEWWHFTLKNEPCPESYFDFPVR